MAGEEKGSNDTQLHKIKDNAAFFGCQNRVDTVVFVHELKGHFRRTWGKFPELLSSDPDLPRLDILLWGYDSYAILPTNRTPTEGTHLLSALGTYIQQDNAIHLVGHSMGSITILQGLLNEMEANRARQHPATAVSFLSLFAAPLNGSNVAAIIKNTLGKMLLLRKLVNPHIRALAKGRHIDKLLDDVFERIYAPRQNDASGRQIPIRMIMATRDRVVSSQDRIAAMTRFTSTPPKQLDYDHSAVKEPASLFDERYRTLTLDMQEGLAVRFQIICKQILDSDRDVSDYARVEFAKRYEDLFRQRFKDAGYDIDKKWDEFVHFIKRAIYDGARYGRPPFDTAARAIIALSSRMGTI